MEIEPESGNQDYPVNIIGVTCGDCNGIGPEVILKTFMDKRLIKDQTILIYGQPSIFTQYMKILNAREFRFNTINSLQEIKRKKINLLNLQDVEGKVEPGTPSVYSGRLAKLALERSGDDLKKGRISAVVTAPVSKENLSKNGFAFPGQTEFFSSLDPEGKPLMLLVSEELRIGLTTGHVPIGEVTKVCTPDKVREKLSTLLESLRKDFGIAKPKVGVMGLNPHAGENGKIGTEEVDWLAPLIEEFRENHNLVFGPIPSDGLFGSGQFKSLDGILGMYHDQALIPFKTLAFESGVNCTVGLSFIRTSPDHGTAFSLAGKNKASASSFRAAFNLANDLIHNRKEGINSQSDLGKK